MDTLLFSGPIWGWEKHHTTEVVTQKKLGFKISARLCTVEPEHSRLIFELEGGPTGYESFFMFDPTRDNTLNPLRFNGYWAACFGTKGRWNELRIHGLEYARVIQDFLALIESEEGLEFEGICNECGRETKVRLCVDPHMDELRNEKHLTILCAICLQEAASDV